MLIDLGDDTAAREEIELLRERAVDHPMVDYLDAVLLARELKFKEAQTALQEIGSALENYAPALLFRATLHYALNELEQGRSVLSRLLTLTPGYLPAEKLLAATLIKQNAVDQAVELLEQMQTRAADDPQIPFLLGSAHLHMQDYDAATRSLERALAMSPGNIRSIMQLAFGQLALAFLEETELSGTENDRFLLTFLRGLAHLQSQEFDQAIALAESLEANQAQNPLGLYLKGGAFFGLNRPAEARQAFEQVVAKVPGFLPAQINLAKLHLREGHRDRGELIAMEVLDRDPKNADAMMLMAEIAWRGNRRGDALRWLEEAVAAAPGGTAPQIALIRLHRESGEPAKAREQAEKAGAAFPDDPEILLLLAEIEIETGNLSEAQPILIRLIELEPDRPSHRYLLAEAYARAGNTLRAKDQLRQLISQDSQQLAAYLRLVDLQLEERDPRGALDTAERLHATIPDSPAADQVLGRVHMSLGQPKEAIEAYKRAWKKAQSGPLAVALYQAHVAASGGKSAPYGALATWLQANPDDASTRLFFAGELLGAGYHDESIQHYEILLAEQPENPLLLNNLAWLYHQKDDGRAIDYAERALAFAPDEAAIMDTLGWILFNRGELLRAQTILETAAGRAPDDPDIGYHFAAALEKAGRRDEARALLARILTEHSAFPSAEEAQSLKERLEAN